MASCFPTVQWLYSFFVSIENERNYTNYKQMREIHFELRVFDDVMAIWQVKFYLQFASNILG